MNEQKAQKEKEEEEEKGGAALSFLLEPFVQEVDESKARCCYLARQPRTCL